MQERPTIAVLGAGPAGLGAAYRLARRRRFDVKVLERAGRVGGNAGSFELAGLNVDYGSHRLHPACAPEILSDIREWLGGDLLDRPRHGRIRIRGRWVHFPLKPADLARNLPVSFSAGVAVDAVRKRLGHPGKETFATVLERGLGATICRDFYFPYARKIWGVEPAQLDGEQARRRVSAGSIGKMLRKILSGVPGFKPPGAGRFFYPRRGFGAISEAYRRAAEESGADIRLNTAVTGVEWDEGCVRKVHAMEGAEPRAFETAHVLSTLPISLLARLMQPGPPEAVQQAACALQFRSMVLIYLVLETPRFTEYDAHYFPGAEVEITRLSEPKNYGLAGDAGQTVLCAELPCSQKDSAWRAPDAELGELVKRALAGAGIPVKAGVKAVTTVRLAQAYPVYLRGYGDSFRALDEWFGGIGGLTTFGRQGLFVHDNTHHALAMAYALDSCLDDKGDLDGVRWQQCREEFSRHVVED